MGGASLSIRSLERYGLEGTGRLSLRRRPRAPALEHPAEPAGQSWSHEDLPKLVAKLWAKFGDPKHNRQMQRTGGYSISASWSYAGR